MTKETFIEEVLENALKAWETKEQGKMATLLVLIGRVDKQTRQEIRPTIRLQIQNRAW